MSISGLFLSTPSSSSSSLLQVIRILKELKQKFPEKELDQLVELANYYALLHQQKSRAFYRIQVGPRRRCLSSHLYWETSHQTLSLSRWSHLRRRE